MNASMTIPTINGLRDVTIFVPNNAAFRAIGSALGNLTMEQVVSILEYHVVNGTVAYSTMLKNMTVPTLQGNSVNITVHNASSVFVNNARVVLPNVLVANGVIHVIDEVLNPNGTAMANGTSSAGTPAYSGASSASMDPFTSGQPTPTSTINTASIQATATGGSGSSSSSGAAWMPKPTNAVGAAALGGLALLML
uniref:FAS1 domain-containing protein n=1 Tax=Araucaria cunninghamii TaxID=56994 RepID=A0A0D6R2U8_ARACU